ncbi:MAG: UbiA-like protein EboC [Armatimonadetes bacterium]|nr:UbiA-like protein EboC [Armatimonadota bacterium]
MRPANVVTAAADILAGFAAAGATHFAALPWLLLATAGLYGGGVVLNDVFDAKLDAIERPERPIPSGRATLHGAILLGLVLLVLGIGAAFMSSRLSGILAVVIAGCVLVYNAWGKHQPLIGPVNMGLCRGLNLLLGVSAAPTLLGDRWYLALLPIIYIASITLVSRGEVSGGSSGTGLLALALLGSILLGLLALGFTSVFSALAALPFGLLFAWLVLPAFWRAYREPSPSVIRIAVKAGVVSLIVFDASIAAGYAGMVFGLAVFSLLFVAARLARVFAVT